MPKQSAGILIYRIRSGSAEVLLAHPGGPFWTSRDGGAWSIPKGEVEDHEKAIEAAIREVWEETGLQVAGPMTELRPIQQKSGKRVLAWAWKGDFNPEALRSNTFRMEWPPGSGHLRDFPEIDRVDWFSLQEAKRKIIPGQIPLLNELAALLMAT